MKTTDNVCRKELIDALGAENVPRVTVLQGKFSKNEEHPEAKQEFLDALRVGSYARANMQLMAGADANMRLPGLFEEYLGGRPGQRVRTHVTPLHLAAAYHKKQTRTKLMKRLLSLGANATATDNEGFTPLHDVAWSNDTECMQMLLDAGAHADAASKDGVTALHYAAYYNAPDTAALLLAKGCNAKAATTEGETALHFAAMTGNCDLVRSLLSAGADVNAREIDGFTPLSRAAYYKEAPDMLRLLAEAGADLNSGNENGATALHFAAMAGMTANIQSLLKLGVNPDSEDKIGSTALLRAAISGHSDAVRTLLGAGASISFRGDNGERFHQLVLTAGSDDMQQTVESYHPEFATYREAYRQLCAKQRRNRLGIGLLILLAIAYCIIKFL